MSEGRKRMGMGGALNTTFTQSPKDADQELVQPFSACPYYGTSLLRGQRGQNNRPTIRVPVFSEPLRLGASIPACYSQSGRCCEAYTYQQTPYLSTTSADAGDHGTGPSGRITCPSLASASYAWVSSSSLSKLMPKLIVG